MQYYNMKILLKEIRLKKGMTQLQLSVISGVSQNSISDIEEGRHFPSVLKMCKLAKALNVTIQELIDCEKLNDDGGI